MKTNSLKKDSRNYMSEITGFLASQVLEGFRSIDYEIAKG